MKKQRMIAMIMAFCMAVSACGNGAPADSPEPDAPQTSTDTESEDTDKSDTAADPQKAVDFAYDGIWKYDTQPLYIDISNNRWKLYNVFGIQDFSGDVIPDGDKVLLKNDKPLDDDSFWLKSAGDGKLEDNDGDILSPAEKLLFMPGTDDPLTNIINFPGDKFGDVTIKYPEEMAATARTDIAHALNFNHTLTGLLKDDFYSTIMIRFQPVTDYDEFLQKGAWLAKYAMSYMLNNMIETFYRDYLIESVGSSFEDKGNYYSIKGYMKFNGNIFKEDIDENMYGVMEIRYYGPTGYVLMSVSVMPENREGYVSYLASKIMDSCSYTTTWTTAPKTVPKTAGKRKSAAKPSKKPAGSDPGDYGDDYYWTDSDGDIWYWNGRENVFVSFGSDGYIDDDGNYYESNDAGWDIADNYVDDYDIGYSDPGDYYEEYSDPGDYYEEYSDPGDYYEEYSDPGDYYDDYSDSGDYGDYGDDW